MNCAFCGEHIEIFRSKATPTWNAVCACTRVQSALLGKIIERHVDAAIKNAGNNTSFSASDVEPVAADALD